MIEFHNIALHANTYGLLKKLKLYPDESFNSLILRLVKKAYCEEELKKFEYRKSGDIQTKLFSEGEDDGHE